MSEAEKLAAEASGGSVDAAETVETASDGSDDPSPTSTIVDVLLSTHPQERPVQYPDLPDSQSHAIIGAKKALNELLDADMGQGTPAAMNFVQAALSHYLGTDQTSQLDDLNDLDGDDYVR